MKNIAELAEVSNGDAKYNQWFGESNWQTYSKGILNELQEVKDEIISADRPDYMLLPDGVTKLEDELGDLLWTCISLIQKLDQDGTIDKNLICEHAKNKFLERIPCITKQEITDKETVMKYWYQAKKLQKKRGITLQNNK